jgi:hypothetical protein
MIESVDEPLIFWNYFIALEEDLCEISRFIEFCGSNYDTYSIELAKLLLSSSSEVDVVLKELCQVYDSGIKNKRSTIKDYRKIIMANIPEISGEKVFIRRYSLILKPWRNWKKDENPDWWMGYNDVKHKRSDNFCKANLKYVLNSIAGLLVIVFYYYKATLMYRDDVEVAEDIMRILQPKSRLLYLKDEYYPRFLIV